MILARLRALPRTEVFALTLAIAVLVFLAFAKSETLKPTAPASYSTYDASGGGARALYELYGREGLREDRFERQSVFLDRSLATLVWLDPLDFDRTQRTPTDAENKALIAWVRAGGKLLYVGHDRAAAHEKFLRLPYAHEVNRAHEKPYVAPALAAFGVGTLTAPSDLRWVPGKHERVLLGDARGPIVVRYAYGRGTVTAVVDQDLFSNDGIARGDRARLAYALAALPHADPIAFEEATHGYLVPLHWWQIAPRPLVVSVVVALVALAIAGIGAAIRFGPPVLPVTRDDASTSDFIGALAGLLRTGNARRSAMVAAAESTTRALGRGLGLGDRATPADIAERLESASVRREYETMLGVATNGYADDRNLVRGVALAQRLRKDHAAHVDRRR